MTFTGPASRADRRTVLVVSDIHYASDAEKARGPTEAQVIRNPLLRALVKAFRHFIWMRNPYGHNSLLDQFLAHPGPADYVVANGDYSCDSSFVGVMDEPTFLSAHECLSKLRGKFPGRLAATIGDHELGKVSLFGGRGGLRLASWHRAVEELRLEPFWQIKLGRYQLVGVTSSLVGLPIYEPETLPGERDEWRRLRENQLREMGAAFHALVPGQRVVLFCHDPTALPFLWQEAAVREKIGQIEMTVIGHFHSKLVYWKSRLLAGIPRIGFLGTSIGRMTSALNQARLWRAFNVCLCPSLAGIELLKDGGYYRLEIDPEGQEPLRAHFHPVRRELAS